MRATTQRTENFDFYNQIAQYRKDTLEINRLLSLPELTKDELKQLKTLLLQDAIDRKHMSADEWQEILHERIVVSPTKKEVALIAQILAMI